MQINTILYCIFEYLQYNGCTWIHSYRHLYNTCKSARNRKLQQLRGSIHSNIIAAVCSMRIKVSYKNYCTNIESKYAYKSQNRIVYTAKDNRQLVYSLCLHSDGTTKLIIMRYDCCQHCLSYYNSQYWCDMGNSSMQTIYCSKYMLNNRLKQHIEKCVATV